MMNDTLLEALEKTYAEIPAEMFYYELIIFISRDWNEKIDFYRGIEVRLIPEFFPDKNKILIMRKEDYKL
jgi:hypothetical protein